MSLKKYNFLKTSCPELFKLNSQEDHVRTYTSTENTGSRLQQVLWIGRKSKSTSRFDNDHQKLPETTIYQGRSAESNEMVGLCINSQTRKILTK